jgi:hypothetical protein
MTVEMKNITYFEMKKTFILGRKEHYLFWDEGSRWRNRDGLCRRPCTHLVVGGGSTISLTRLAQWHWQSWRALLSYTYGNKFELDKFG